MENLKLYRTLLGLIDESPFASNNEGRPLSMYHAVAWLGVVCPDVKLAPVELCGPLGDCYRNAGNVAIMNDRFHYFEGLAMTDAVPGELFTHAWLYDRETEQFLEPTWRTAGNLYVGFGLARVDLLQIVVSCEHWGPFFEGLVPGDVWVPSGSEEVAKYGFTKPLIPHRRESFFGVALNG